MQETQQPQTSFDKPKKSTKAKLMIGGVSMIAVALLLVVGYLIVQVTANQPEEVIVSSETGGEADANGLSLGDASSTENDKNLSLITGGSTQSNPSTQGSTSSGSTGSSGSQGSSAQGLPAPGSPQTSGAPKPVRSQTLDNGLKIEEYVYGEGAGSKSGDKLAMHYVGYLTNGTVFDTSLKGNKTPFVFTLGTGQVIKGWDIGLQDMRVGAVRRLTIPASLAYGAAGSPPGIPPNATLIFDVQLMAIQ